MAIIDMGDIQDLVERLICEVRAAIPLSTSNTAQTINAAALVDIAEQLHEVNGYLAAISERMDQVYECTGSSAEPRIKDCTTCKHKNVQFNEHPCIDCGIGNPGWEPA